MNVYDGGQKTITMVAGTGSIAVTNFRGRLDHIVVDAPSDTVNYYVEILNSSGNAVWIDSSTGDHTFKVNMIMGKNFTVRVRNADQAGDFIAELAGEQGVK